jgi:hypothetical protein
MDTMKTMRKNLIPLILVIILTACNAVAPQLTETPIPTVTSLPTSTTTPEPTITPFLEIPTPIIPTPIPTPYFTFVVDRTNPESVIRAWFDGLVRGDGVAMGSVESRPELRLPVFDTNIKSIEILEMKLISQSAGSYYHYRVRFTEQGFRDGKEYKEQPEWDFELIWDGERQSFVIFNHGVG